MANFNRVILMGNLTRDIELRYTSNNTAIGKIGLAVNRRYRTQEGENREETTFVDCEAWGRTAEIMNQYLSKGRPVLVEGRLRLDQWQDREGRNRSKLMVVIENFQFVGGREDAGAGRQGGPPQQRSGGAGDTGGAGGAGGASQPPGDSQYEPIDEDDIPF
ncbi:MAG: single-stranded DNA-binding protein [Phycisphaerales bacterium]|nr:single-stranded DNA-binding protein [Phycisphaerales bacterium]